MSRQYLNPRAQYIGELDYRKRVPETTPMGKRKVALVGLGSIGAPIAIELARAGIGHLYIVDYDVVDAGNACRWPLGIASAGTLKITAIARFIAENFILTKVSGQSRRFGAVCLSDPPSQWKSDYEFLDEEFADIDLLIDASAEEGVMHLLSDWAWRHEKDYLMVAGTTGGWGGEVALISRQAGSGCWMCYRAAQVAKDIPTPPTDDPEAKVQPRGCGSPTFTGTGFDMQQIALVGVRKAVGHLCQGVDGGYPAINDDVFIVLLRTKEGICTPVSVTSCKLAPRGDCPNCSHDR